jgi:predicted Zn-dependent protease with MMP-like domain
MENYGSPTIEQTGLFPEEARIYKECIREKWTLENELRTFIKKQNEGGKE